MEQTPQHPKFVRWAVLIGIVIALNLFFWVGRSLIIPEPKYEDYCPTHLEQIFNEEACVAADGVWMSTAPTPRQETGPSKPLPPQAVDGYCDFYQKCQPVYDEEHKQYLMYGFSIMVGLGVLSLIVGVLPIGSSIVSSGLSYGGVLALIIAAIQYWGEAENLLRLAISVIALVALLYIGIRRFRD
jgi:hypothetical protein